MKEEMWEAQQNAQTPPGAGPHSSLQNVPGVTMSSVPERKNRQQQVEQTVEETTTPTQSVAQDTIYHERRAQLPSGLILPNEPTVAQLQQAILHLIDIIAAWLFIICGLSRTASVSALKLIHALVVMSIQTGHLAAQQQMKLTSTHFKTPLDPRTSINHLSIEPILRRSVHCPTCFTWYDGASFPMLCAFRPTPKSRICAARLIMDATTRKGTRKVPRRLYTTQDFKSWLEFFLSRPGIEDLIHKSHTHQPNPHAMVSIWDSPSWQSIRTEDGFPFCTQAGNLTFSFYIDWFNPLLNKTAGRIVSSGAIVFYCLNLPYDIQGLPENIFVAGLTPAPKEPTMTTIIHLLDPVIDQFEEMWQGAVICTYLHPEGTFYRVGVLPGIGDLPGMRKAFGRAGVGSKRHLCSLCKIHKDQINDINTSFPPHTSHEVSEAGRQWKEAETQKERKKILDESGVRWSPMLRLTYRDSVQHTVLGVMHNWIEGIIQHHIRVFWSIGVPSGVAKAAIPQTLRRSSHSSQTSDSPASFAPPFYSVTQQGFAMDIDQNYESTDTDNSSASSFGDSEIHTVDDSAAEETADQELADEESQPRNIKTFTTSQLTAIRLCISDAVTPSWLARPPSNLGEAGHGKLKADEWLVLCTIFLPLVLPEIWYDQPFHSLLANFVHLVTCTNLLSSHLVTDQNADLYTSHYIEYRRTSLELFPDVNTRPNHHFAMHNGDLMKYWGPLIKVSEYSGERVNGMLQRIPTNGRIRDMDFTMIRQLCRKGRLNASIQREQQQYIDSKVSHHTDEKEKSSSAAHIFHESLNTLAGRSTSIPSKPPVTYSHTLPNNLYEFLLAYTNFQRDIPFRRYDDFPHPNGAKIYPHWATPLTSITIHDRTYTIYSKHRGNASVYFSHPYYPHLNTGFINSIWSQQIEGVHRTFLCVQPPIFLSQNDAVRDPYASQALLGLMGMVAYNRVGEDYVVVEAEHVHGHVPYYVRPPGTFGINEGTMVMLNSLHRHRGKS